MPPPPHFLVIGAQKAGTTWLERNLGAHPGVFTPRHKELHYFDKAATYARGPEAYRAFFAACSPDQIAGEFTPNYMWEPEDPAEIAESGHVPGVAARAHAFDPNLRWIAVLRDPVDRAVSAYYHHIRARRVRPDQPISAVWHRFGIRSMGLYAHHLQPWLERFPPEQGKILFFESDIRARPRETLHALYRFLNLDPTFVPPALERVHNPANSHFLLHLNHRVPLLARLMQKVHRGFGASWKRFHIPVQDAERAALQACFAQPNKELAALFTDKTMPLPKWLLVSD